HLRLSGPPPGRGGRDVGPDHGPLLVGEVAGVMVHSHAITRRGWPTPVSPSAARAITCREWFRRVLTPGGRRPPRFGEVRDVGHGGRDWRLSAWRSASRAPDPSSRPRNPPSGQIHRPGRLGYTPDMRARGAAGG